jgi:hypothetical protein
MVFGLLFSMFVSLLLIPAVYLLAHRRHEPVPRPLRAGAAASKP